MEAQHKSNLATLGIQVIKNFQKGEGDRTVREFDMKNFFIIGERRSNPSEAAEHRCGTSCCLLGYAAVVFPEQAEDECMWIYLSSRLFGIDSFSHIDDYYFLFHEGWPNDPFEAGKRILLVLQGRNPHVLHSEKKGKRFLTETPENLLKKLQAYVIQE